MASTYQVSQIFKKQNYAAGTYRETINASRWSSGAIQWVHPTTGLATPATLTIYASLKNHKSDDLADLDPATNPYWAAQPAAVFASNPGDVVKSELLTISDNPYMTLMVELVVVTPLVDFELLFRGQEA